MDRDNRDKLIEAAKESVFPMAMDALCDVEYIDIVHWLADFAAERVRAERERIAQELEVLTTKPATGPGRYSLEVLGRLTNFISELRGEG